MAELLVLGLGNLLLGDDGVGPAVIERLHLRYDMPARVDVLDGGTLGLALLGEVGEARAAILVDAVKTDDPPGTLVRFDGDEVAPAVGMRLSPHQFGVADLLGAARLLGREPPRLVLLGVVPQSIELGVGLTPPVENSLEALIEAVVEECAALGHSLHHKAA